MERLLKTRKTLQSPVHARGAHAETHRGEAPQMHGKNHFFALCRLKCLLGLSI